MSDVISVMILFLMIIGTLSSLMNVIIYRSRKFRLNSCIFYLLCSTIFDWIYLLTSGLIRLNESRIMDMFNRNELNLFCKIRIYILVLTPTLSTCYLMLASLDRCFSTSSSTKWRNFSEEKVGWKISLFTFIFFVLINSHILSSYQIGEDSIGIRCIPSGKIYRIFFSIFVLLTNPFVLYLMMFGCTMITLIRIRRSRIRMNLFLNRRRNVNLDRHLIQIMLVQIGLGMFFTFFRCGFLIYLFLTTHRTKNISQRSFDLFFDQFTLFIYYINIISILSNHFLRIFSPVNYFEMFLNNKFNLFFESFTILIKVNWIISMIQEIFSSFLFRRTNID